MDERGQTGRSTEYGPLRRISKLSNGRYFAVMDVGAFMPGVASTFDADDVTLDPPPATAAIADGAR